MKRLSVVMERLDDKETPGCLRYRAVGGDAGLESIYLKKVAVGEASTMPKRVHVIVEESNQ